MRADATFLGHSTVLLEMGGQRVLTDPVLFDRVTMLRRTASPLPAELYADVDVVVISHAHHDHLDLPSLRLFGSDVQLVVPRGIAPVLREAGFERVIELTAGTAVDVGDLHIAAVKAVHSGFRVPFGPLGEAVGYLIDEGSERVYFAGDTDLFEEMAELEGIDLALVPVWGWGPRLGVGHLDPRTAAEAVALLRPTAVVPIHWGTLWPMGMARVTPGRLQEPPVEFARQAERAAPGVRILVTPPGETIAIPR
jgi:L-ascorbate metabolism protein UlaG (beta-lactamase superfamily)